MSRLDIVTRYCDSISTFQTGCVGDSGGPVFYLNEDNTAYLVGILSKARNAYQLNPDGTSGRDWCGNQEQNHPNGDFDTIASSVDNDVVDWIIDEQHKGPWYDDFDMCLCDSGWSTVCFI